VNDEDYFDPLDDQVDEDDAVDEIERLRARVEALESQSATKSSSRSEIGLLYALGMAVAVTLSWSRNASILWCIGHGLLSWGYVIFFALTR
jgi:hypothetical protein